MSFIKSVQDEIVTEPTRRNFRASEWRAQGKRLSTGERDDNLVDVGLWVYERLDNVRKSLKFVSSEEHNWTTKVTALAAIANLDCIRLRNRLNPTLTLNAELGKTVMADKVSSVRIGLAEGGEYSPDEVLQGIVDGVQIPIKFVLNGKISEGELPKISRVNWDDVGWDMNAGNAYFGLEALWDDCLWNDYMFDASKGAFHCTNENRLNLKVVSEQRRDTLTQQFFHLSRTQLQWLVHDELERLIGIHPVVGISRDGRRHKYEIGKNVNVDDLGLDILIARAFAQEEYYSKLLNQTGIGSPNVTLQLLLNCWHVIRTATEVHWEAALQSERDWNALCPSIQLPALYEAVSTALGIKLGVAREAVNFFVYRGDAEQSLWTQPLVWVGRDKAVPIFGAIRYCNLGRTIDIWMRQLGLDLSERGIEFEKYVRSKTKEFAEKSPISSSISTIDGQFVFRPKDSREEEIDLIFTVGSMVFLGEVKCFLQPAEAKEFGRHWTKVTGAIEQIKRKAESVKQHRGEFVQALKSRGLLIEENFDVFPIVILNGPIHVGTTVDGVPVADTTLLRIYFEGQANGMTMVSTTGKTDVKQVFRLYENVDEAKATAMPFFQHPIYLRHLWESLAPREVPIIGMKDGTPVNEGDYLLKEVRIDFDSVQRKFDQLP